MKHNNNNNDKSITYLERIVNVFFYFFQGEFCAIIRRRLRIDVVCLVCAGDLVKHRDGVQDRTRKHFPILEIRAYHAILCVYVCIRVRTCVRGVVVVVVGIHTRTHVLRR